MCQIQLVVLVMLVGLSLPAEPAWAQALAPRATVLLTNRYLWRGIHRASGWNVQPEVSLSLRSGRGQGAAGIWSNLELSTHRDGSLTDLQPGQWGASEFDFWIETARRFTGGDLAAGFIWYQYRGRLGNAGTGEVYARFRGSGINPLKIAPELSLWYDPIERNSAYLETALTAPVIALPFIEPVILGYTTLTGGFALGRSDGAPGLASASFEKSGFTHADASAGIRARQGLLGGTLLLNLAGHLMYAHDPATRRKSLRTTKQSSWFRPLLTLEGGLSWPAYPRR